MSRQAKSHERVNQKKRTRAELLRAARELSAEGSSLAIPDVADRAGISRATAYRYFSTPDELMHEIALDAAALAIRVPDDPALDAGAKLEIVILQVLAMLEEHETTFRHFLAARIVEKGGKRGGRRLHWLDETLRPLADVLPRSLYTRLLHALSLVMGMETMVVMKDVCGLDAKESEAVIIWTARAMLGAALEEARDR
ncbi:TetR/AcrR family transcriptional regulator [Martelella limonii]|uniref:TetR/AcrR family transcriptional regulator n=1 Tax=Martelella limonii TaxID=1647649 RepID=UPI0015807B4D|nr:helix-turn-helix domain-containing protein [Martelella limonii]